MSQLPNNILIALIDIEQTVKIHEDEPLEDRLRAAMGTAKDHYMLRTDDEMVQAAMEGVARTADDAERTRLEEELERLNTLSAVLSGVPVDFGQVTEPENPIGVLKLWREVKG